MVKTGIYKLLWPQDGYFYLGRSIDIQKRYEYHTKEFKNGHHSRYIRPYYNKYGCEPELHVIEECSADELEEKERYYLAKEANNSLCINKIKYNTNSTYVKKDPSKPPLRPAKRIIFREQTKSAPEVNKSYTTNLTNSWVVNELIKTKDDIIQVLRNRLEDKEKIIELLEKGNQK